MDIYGPAKNPTFTFKNFFGQTVCTFAVGIGADERLVCSDGRKWKVEKMQDGTVVSEGELASPLPVLDTSTAFDFAADLTGDTPCVVDILKEYR